MRGKEFYIVTMTDVTDQTLPASTNPPPSSSSSAGSAGKESPKPHLSVPHNTEIEAALLSALLLDNKKIEEVAELLRPEYFYAPHNARIYELITDMSDKHQVVTVSTLRHFFASDPILQEGGLDYLAELATNANPLLGSSAEYYANTIADFYRKRQLITLGEEIVQSAFDLTDLDNTADKQIETAESKLYTLAEGGATNGQIMTLSEALKSAIDGAANAVRRDSHVAGVTTGFRDIDDLLGGLHPSDLVILAGRPAMGKTALATNIAFNAARKFQEREAKDGSKFVEGGRVLFFSLEMSSDQLGLRILAEQAKIPGDKMRRGMIGQEDLDRVTAASLEIAHAPISIDDTPGLSVSALRQRARRLKRSKGLELIVIDYLQLLQATLGKRHDNRVMELSDITRSLKNIAKELNVPVLALSQLSREVEKRDDKRPMLSDLRESGTIEQDADVVMFLYREEYYLQRGAPTHREGLSEAKIMELDAEYNQKLEAARDKALVIVAKQRHGKTGNVDLHFNAEFTQFSDLVKHDVPYDLP